VFVFYGKSSNQLHWKKLVGSGGSFLFQVGGATSGTLSTDIYDASEPEKNAAIFFLPAISTASKQETLKNHSVWQRDTRGTQR
jgi:hypothetical protein